MFFFCLEGGVVYMLCSCNNADFVIGHSAVNSDRKKTELCIIMWHFAA